MHHEPTAASEPQTALVIPFPKARRQRADSYISKPEMMRRLEVSHKSVERLMQRGMPFEKAGQARNAPVYFPLLRSQVWLRDHGYEVHAERLESANVAFAAASPPRWTSPLDEQPAEAPEEEPAPTSRQLSDADIAGIAARAVELLTGDEPSASGRSHEQHPAGYMTVAEAARYLACSPRRLYQLVRKRAVPFVRDGRRYLFRASSLDAWLDNGGARPWL